MDRESIHLIKCEYHYRFFQHNWFFLTKYNFQQQLHRWGQLESYRVRWNSERVLKFLLLLLFLFSRSVMSDSFVNLWTVARQTPLSMGFPRQEYWSGLAFPSPGDLLTQRSKLHLLCPLRRQEDSWLLSYRGSPIAVDGKCRFVVNIGERRSCKPSGMAEEKGEKHIRGEGAG